MNDRYFYSTDGLWCDRTKPWDENHPDFDPEYLEGEGPWFEEIEVGEVLNDQDFIITELKQAIDTYLQALADDGDISGGEQVVVALEKLCIVAYKDNI
jgi:hypothetical protein